MTTPFAIHPETNLEDLKKTIEELDTSDSKISQMIQTSLDRIREEEELGNKTIGEVLTTGNKSHLIESLHRIDTWNNLKGAMVNILGYGGPL